MKKYQKYLLIGFCAVSLGIGGFVYKVHATPSQLFTAGTSTATATSTLKYMTPGAATTTLPLNIYTLTALDGSNANGLTLDGNQLDIILKASTSAATLKWWFQCSRDNNDFADVDLVGSTIAFGQSEFHHASSTINNFWNPGNLLASTSEKVVDVPVCNTQYMRVQFTMNPGSVNGAVWAQFLPKRQLRANNR